jgi:Ca2+-binding RTX toxin-like protein
VNQNLQAAQAIALQYLTKFAKSDNFWQDFELAFGSNFSRETALNIQNQLKNSTFTIPTISIVSQQTLGTANGAFAAENQTIYLSSSFLANSTAQTIANTLIEEIGHSIDAQINTQDSAGDEGQLFSALVRGEKITASQLAGLKAENDRAVINVGGKSLAVEKQDYSGTSANDTFAGTTGNDIFAFGGVGIPLLTSLGIDTISDFTSGDKIKLHKSTFGAITSAAGANIGSSFASVADDTLVESQTAQIIYSQATGHLFYNTNGSTVGYGTNGGLFAVLSPNLNVTSNDFLIVDDKVNLAVSTPSVAEDGATDLVYTFSRTETATALTVNFTVGGTATLATDYVATNAATFTGTTGTVTFAAGVATATVTINPSTDALVEDSEIVALTLAAGNGYTVGTATAVSSTIVNDDTSVTLAVTPASVNEDGTSNLLYTFTRTGVLTNALTVNYGVAGSATLGTDYAVTGTTNFTASGGNVTFLAGSATAVVTIDPTLDTTVELNETVALTLNTGSGYLIGTPTAVTGTISNDDTEISLAVSSSSVDENGTPNIVYTFTRAGNASTALSVNYTVGGTATFSTDYTQNGASSFSATGGSVSFAIGETTKIVTIDPTPDTTVEASETVALTLANGTGYKVAGVATATGTIVNDDTNVTLAVSPATVTENGADKLKYTFTRTGVLTNALTVNYGIAAAATLDTTDYTLTGDGTFAGTAGTVTFAIGSATAIIEIDPSVDTTVEANETLALTLLPNGTAYTIGTPTAVIGTIVNDDTDVTLAVSPNVNEDGTANLTYTFTRTGVTTSALTVNYGIGGSAGITDYAQTGGIFNTTTNTGTVTFAIGATTALVTVNPTNDVVLEGDETLALTLAAGTGYNVATTTPVTGTILNDDTNITLAVSPDINEDGAGSLVYTFTRTGITTNALTVNYGVGGTAALSTDYTQTGAATFTATTGSVTFAAGSSTAIVTINPTDDIIVESGETVALTLTAGVGYTIPAPTTVTGTILNDDTLVTLAVAPATVTENGTTNLVYTFTRAGNTAGALTVSYNIGGDASSTDYTQTGGAFSGTTGTVTFAANSTTAIVTVTPTQDATVELSETLALTLTAGGGGYIIGTTAPVIGTIVNDDTNVSLAVSAPTVTEDGVTNAIYTFTRTGVTTSTLAVNYTIGGTATNVIDYSQSGGTVTGSTGTVVFAVGATTAIITVNPNLDTTVEPNETVELTLAAGAPGAYNILTTAPVTTTITNDDTLVTLAVAPVSVNEDGAPSLVYTFTRTGIVTNTLDVKYTISGTAINGTDYTSLPTTVSFLANASTATVTINPTDDTIVEIDETIALTLASGTGYNIGTTTAVTGTIINDDTNVTLAVSPATVSEDGADKLKYTFTRTGVLTNALTVNYGITAAATLDTNDYTQTGAATFSGTAGTVTFLANSATAIVEIDPTSDPNVEANETLALTLLPNGTAYTIGTTTAVTGTILNDDTLVTLAVAPATVTEDGATNLVYTFTRSGITTGALTVNYGIGGTADATDYAQFGAATFGATAGTVTFLAGATTATVTINPNADIAFEENETVALTLATGAYNIGTTAAVVGTITNEDTVPAISIADTIIIEGIGSAPTQALITLSLNKTSYQAVTVNYATSDVSAIAGTDYTAITNGLLTFAAGELSKTISVDIINNDVNEINETFDITLTTPGNATLADNKATITITDTFTSSITSTLAASVENLTLTGVAVINGTGNIGDNVLTGNTANNTLAGLAGNDTYSYDADLAQGTDTITEASAGGTDTLDFSQTALGVNVNLSSTITQTVTGNLKLVMPVLELENAIGGSGNDRIGGNALDNTLNGGLGDDKIFAAAGNDSIFGGAGNDFLGGGAGIDTFNYNGLLSGFTTATALLGVDTLSDFTTTQDKIALSKATFGAITSAVGAAMGANFIAVEDDTLVSSQAAAIVYSMSTGSLFYNQNGAVAGLGTNGGEFATLLGMPTLASADFTVVA